MALAQSARLGFRVIMAMRYWKEMRPLVRASWRLAGVTVSYRSANT
jgi:hypothetical protein